MGCGVAGGSDELNPQGNSGWFPEGAELNQDGRSLPELNSASWQKIVWAPGSVVNVSWSINANHGGGYQYRLCKKSSWPTEECFQATPMKFASRSTFIQYCPQEQQLAQMCCDSETYKDNGKCTQAYEQCGEAVAYSAVDVNTGTIPAGSTWRMNPILLAKAVQGDQALRLADGKEAHRHRITSLHLLVATHPGAQIACHIAGMIGWVVLVQEEGATTWVRCGLSISISTLWTSLWCLM